MKTWGESQDDVNSVRPDKEMAKSLMRMMEIRLKAVESLEKDKFVSIIAEGYYEIIKEGITALMAIDGYKTLSHEVLVGYLHEFYKEFSEYEIRLIDQLRKLRNKIVYEGFFVQKDYLERNEKQLKEIVARLKLFIGKKL